MNYNPSTIFLMGYAYQNWLLFLMLHILTNDMYVRLLLTIKRIKFINWFDVTTYF